MKLTERPRIAIVGATGAVGAELLTLMEERAFPFSELHLIASERSVGKTIDFRNRSHTIQRLETFDFSRVDIAFFSAGTELSKTWARKAAAQGALVIDNTNAFRMDANTPLVVPQVNGHLLHRRPSSGIIANPNCSTIQMVRVLDPIHKEFGLQKAIVSTYQAASGGGLTGMNELTEGIRAALVDPMDRNSRKFPRPLAFNVVPQIDVFLENGFTLEEQKMLQESRRILSLPKLNVSATAVRVPVMNGHSEAVYLETIKAVEPKRVVELLRKSEEIEVFEGNDYPTPRFLSQKNRVHVGRIRKHPENEHALWCWISADNLRIGAALNAIQIAEQSLLRME
ncbi:MAG: aspartate-semialdehyde dehydrogenase [Bdellovibrionota bacterium]